MYATKKEVVDEARKILRPRMEFYEAWNDEVAIDATVWTVTDPAIGAAWSRGASGAYLRATAAPNANEVARIVSDQCYIAAPNVFSTNTILKRLIVEFELKLTNLANIDRSESFFGLTTDVGHDRSDNNIIGWDLKGAELGFNTGSVEFTVDELLTGAGGGTGNVVAWHVTSGTWVGGSAAGLVWLKDRNAIDYVAAEALTGGVTGVANAIAIQTNQLGSVTDSAGTETTGAGFIDTPTNWTKLRMEIFEGHVYFFTDDFKEPRAVHSTNLPDAPMWQNYYLDTTAGGAATIELGTIRLWAEDFVR